MALAALRFARVPQKPVGDLPAHFDSSRKDRSHRFVPSRVSPNTNDSFTGPSSRSQMAGSCRFLAAQICLALFSALWAELSCPNSRSSTA